MAGQRRACPGCLFWLESLSPRRAFFCLTKQDLPRSHNQKQSLRAPPSLCDPPANPGHYPLSRLPHRKVRLSALSGCWRQVYVFKLLGLLQPDWATGSAPYRHLGIFGIPLSCCSRALGPCMLGSFFLTLTLYQAPGAWQFRLRWPVSMMGPCHSIVCQEVLRMQARSTVLREFQGPCQILC